MERIALIPLDALKLNVISKARDLHRAVFEAICERIQSELKTERAIIRKRRPWRSAHG